MLTSIDIGAGPSFVRLVIVYHLPQKFELLLGNPTSNSMLHPPFA